MNRNQLEKYKIKLLELDNRLDSEIDGIANEIASAGIPVGEHDKHVRESPDANLAIGKNEEAIQHNVRTALKRIDLGAYGKCVDCRKTIVKERLEALPYTPYCIDCEMKHEVSESRSEFS